MKYVMFEMKNKNITKRTPIIFPSYLSHDIIAEVVSKVLETVTYESVKVVSAGEVNLGYDIECFGSSESLKLSSMGADDEQVIAGYDYLHGIVI